jgi:hypothetical protein
VPLYLTHDDGDEDTAGGANHPFRVTAERPRDAAACHIARLRKRAGPDLGGWGDGGTVTVTAADGTVSRFRLWQRQRVEFDLVPLGDD